MISPWWMLGGVLAMVCVVWLADRIISRRRARRLRRLAERCGFRYSSVDRFCLAGRLRGLLPGEPIIRDLMYRSDNGGYVYAFTAVCAAESQRRFVLRAREAGPDGVLRDVERGDASLPLGEQYRRLLHDALPPAAE